MAEANTGPSARPVAPAATAWSGPRRMMSAVDGTAVDRRAWAAHLTGLGYDEPRVLGAGMDGVVWALGGGLVAKAWHIADVGRLTDLGAFLDDVAHAGLPFATPRILDVATGPGGAAWTLEPELSGRPLLTPDDTRSPRLTPRVVETLLDVCTALGEVAPTPAMRRAAVLGEARPLREGGQSFPAGLADLVERRVAVTGPAVAALVPGLADLATGVAERLRSLTDTVEALVHGDLFGANVLVDETLTPTAVLDLGLLSVAGDPVFDLAVVPGIVDLYGPDAAANRTLLEDAVTERFGVEPEQRSLYLLAYALLTAAWYDPTGRDGHTAWCAAVLRGPDADPAPA